MVCGDCAGEADTLSLVFGRFAVGGVVVGGEVVGSSLPVDGVAVVVVVVVGERVVGGFSTTTDVDTVSDSLPSFAVLIVVLSDVGVEKVMVSF